MKFDAKIIRFEPPRIKRHLLDLPHPPQDQEVSTDEFRGAIKRACVGKPFHEFPEAFRAYIASAYRTLDIDGKTANSSQCRLFHPSSKYVLLWQANMRM